VVYSCGSLVHGGQLIVPYGISDYATTFAAVPLGEVLAAMLLIPMKVVSDSDLIPVAGSDAMVVTVGAKRRWRSYRA
jgi:hypothetical protein